MTHHLFLRQIDFLMQHKCEFLYSRMRYFILDREMSYIDIWLILYFQRCRLIIFFSDSIPFLIFFHISEFLLEVPGCKFILVTLLPRSCICLVILFVCLSSFYLCWILSTTELWILSPTFQFLQCLWIQLQGFGSCVCISMACLCIVFIFVYFEHFWGSTCFIIPLFSTLLLFLFYVSLPQGLPSLRIMLAT